MDHRLHISLNEIQLTNTIMVRFMLVSCLYKCAVYFLSSFKNSLQIDINLFNNRNIIGYKLIIKSSLVQKK